MRWFFLLALLCCGVSHAQPLPVNDGEVSIVIKPYTRYLLDPDKQHTIESIRSLPDSVFQPFTDSSKAINFGLTPDAIWLKLEIENKSQVPRQLFVDFDFAEINSIVMYQVTDTDSIIVEKTGSFYSNFYRPFRSRTLTLPISLSERSVSTVYFQVESLTIVSLPATLYSEASFIHQQFILDTIIYLLLGVYCGFFLYHFIIYLGNREIVYLAFCATTICRLSYDVYFTGVGQLLAPFNVGWNSDAPAYVGGLASAGAIWFHIEFLNLRDKAPKTAWFMFGILGAFLVGINVGYFIHTIGYYLIIPLYILLPILLTISTIPWVIKGYRPARIYFLGSIVTLISVQWSNLCLLGFIPASYNLALYSSLGYSLSFVIFAHSVSEKIGDLRRSEQAAHLEAESALLKAQTKTNFLANMSHEIRTPLNGVLGMIQLLKDSPLKQEQEKWVKIINASGNTLLNIVNDILDFSKIEAGKLSVDKVPCDLRNIVEECYEVFRHTHNNKDIDFSIAIDNHLPQFVITDPARIRQIIINLLGNAFKFTERGVVSINIEKQAADNWYRLAVTDSGIGIAAEQQSKLFVSFEQTGTDTYRRFGGTGLGLAISKELAELLGGTIGVDSELGKGSTFWVDLPLPSAEKSIKSDDADSLASDDNFLQKPLNILVAEDNQVNQIVVKALLGKLGHTCDLVDDGQKAIDALRDNNDRYQVVLMDCDMPVKNGYEATQIIREYETKNKSLRIPIVALTAHVSESFREKSLMSGMDEHLTKPLDISALRNTLSQYAQGGQAS